MKTINLSNINVVGIICDLLGCFKYIEIEFINLINVKIYLLRMLN